MVDLRSGSATNSESTNTETASGADGSSNDTATSLADLGNTEGAPSSITPPVTRARVASTPNTPTQSANPSGTEGGPSRITPPVTRARATATVPNTSASTSPPTAARTTSTPPPGRETRGVRPYVTIADLMERQEVLARAQTDMVSTQKEVLVFIKALTERLPRESRQPGSRTDTPNNPEASTSTLRELRRPESRIDIPNSPGDGTSADRTDTGE
ncbi:uncharacterized protein PB18E9.04c-like [Papaver somniferum]|uniref:uncharacterized protein PB18E9.04c-like n=1 Tax=Papaver somniferum TaxID=3469 RepID=UPI000E6F96C9|nr:uncharacterized protein PB18E9.04c-like [Papaver somniferum]